jgi:hypothetical protein
VSIPPAAAIARHDYVNLTSYRRDGTPLSTPVWCVARGDFLFVWTRADSGKVKRINRDPVVRVAVCTVRGRPLSPAWPATARVIGGGGEEMVRALMADKYGSWKIRWSLRLERLRGRRSERVAIQITLGGDLGTHDDSPVFREA